MKALTKHQPVFTLTNDASRTCKEIIFNERRTCNKPSVFMVVFAEALDTQYYSDTYMSSSTYYCLDHFDAAKQCVFDEWNTYLRNVQDELVQAYDSLQTLIPELTYPSFKDL